MKQYTVYLETELEKYDLIRAARESGCTLTDVSGCGTGYLVSLEASADAAELLQRLWYSPEIDSLTADRAWLAWKGQRLTMGQLATWQERHGLRFTPEGEVIPC